MERTIRVIAVVVAALVLAQPAASAGEVAGIDDRDACCWIERLVDDMYIRWEGFHKLPNGWDAETKETVAVVDGDGGALAGDDCAYFLMHMRHTWEQCRDDMIRITWSDYGLIAGYDPSTGDRVHTIRLPYYGNVMPAPLYRGLACDEQSERFFYCRAYQPMVSPPQPPRSTIYLIDSSGRPMARFVVRGHYIHGLALDADHDHLFCIARGDPDVLLEYDVSGLDFTNRVPELLQGPIPVPWSRETTRGAAGLDYDEEQDILVAIDRFDADGTELRTKECFRDIDPGYAGPPGPGEPGVEFVGACEIVETPSAWALALMRDGDDLLAYVGGSPSEHPFPLDVYEVSCGGPVDRVVPPEHPNAVLSLGVDPDPFNPVTSIEYALPEACHVRLDVYNVAGKRVATLIDRRQEAGVQSVRWDAAGLASGVYFCRLSAGDAVVQRKVTLLK